MAPKQEAIDCYYYITKKAASPATKRAIIPARSSAEPHSNATYSKVIQSLIPIRWFLLFEVENERIGFFWMTTEAHCLRPTHLSVSFNLHWKGEDLVNDSPSSTRNYDETLFLYSILALWHTWGSSLFESIYGEGVYLVSRSIGMDKSVHPWGHRKVIRRGETAGDSFLFSEHLEVSDLWPIETQLYCTERARKVYINIPHDDFPCFPFLRLIKN